jgi:hypothetical protein
VDQNWRDENKAELTRAISLSSVASTVHHSEYRSCFSLGLCVVEVCGEGAP